MARRRASLWPRSLERSMLRLGKTAIAAGTKQVQRQVTQALKPVVEAHKPPPGDGDWLTGLAIGAGGTRKYHLYRPPGVRFGERLPVMVMLHGCQQDARGFAIVTRMNRLAARERCLVLYPEQDRLANAQGCWNWFDTRAGRAQAEAALILNAIDQTCLLHRGDAHRVALAGLSAGASMAALLATRYPQRFRAVVMHAGVPPGLADSTLGALRAMGGFKRGAADVESKTETPVRRRTRRLLEAAADATPVAEVATELAQTLPPLLVIHGSRDLVVSPRNATAAAQAWAEVMQARPTASRRTQRGQRHPSTVTDWKRGRRTVVRLVEVDGLGHAWSGGAARQRYSDPAGPDATRMAWSFAAANFVD